MINKSVLFIDDSDITEIVNKLRTILKRQGITLVESIFNLNKQDYRKENPDEPGNTILDFDKIKKQLEEEYMNNRFDYVACDFNFKDKYLNGFKLIKWLKNVSKSERKFKIRNAKFSLYSSETNDSVKKFFTEDDIGNLIKLRLEDFYDRARITEELGTSIIKNLQVINLKEELISELDRYKEMKFKSVYPNFKDFTLGEIASEIADETHHGIAFQKSLIELSISHIIQLNNED